MSTSSLVRPSLGELERAADGAGERIERARSALGRLVAAGFRPEQVARWFGVPEWTDARYVNAPADRVRRGLGGFIALLVAGETVEADALRLLDVKEWAALVELGLVEEAAGRLRATVRLLPISGGSGVLVVGSDRGASEGEVGAPDVSALNVASCLPRRLVGPTLDVGCGAGLLTLACAQAGAQATGGDVDERALAFARLNARLNGLATRFVLSDLFDGAPGRFALITFNAPLLRAPLAVSDETAAPRYLSSPRGEALALDFLAQLDDHLLPDREALLHAQLTPAVEAALTSRAARARVTSLLFAAAPDGTPHALTAIGPGAGRVRVRVVLGPLCPHLRREILDAHRRPRAPLDERACPIAAPWLELRESRQLGGPTPGWRQVSFGGVPLDEAERKLLERLDGTPLSALALDDEDRARLERLLKLGLAILR